MENTFVLTYFLWSVRNVLSNRLYEFLAAAQYKTATIVRAINSLIIDICVTDEEFSRDRVCISKESNSTLWLVLNILNSDLLVKGKSLRILETSTYIPGEK